MTFRRARRLSWMLVWIGSASCADLSRGNNCNDVADTSTLGDAGANGEGSTQNGDAASSFAGPVHALLTASCQSCHAAGKEAGDTSFLLTGDPSADFASTSPFVDINAPASSRLLTKMAGRGHGGGTLFAAESPEYQTVLRWIEEGATL